jgi:hypothetical protein
MLQVLGSRGCSVRVSFSCVDTKLGPTTTSEVDSFKHSFIHP